MLTYLYDLDPSIYTYVTSYHCNIDNIDDGI